MADLRHLTFARELEERDERVAAAISVVRGLEADVAEVRARAEGIAAIQASYPLERERLEQAVARARTELAAREADQVEAEAELARAKEGEQQAAARRTVVRTKDAAASARRKLAHLEEEQETLERDLARAEAELPRLVEHARALARRLAELPQLASVDVEPGDLPALLDWGARARAALFVACGGLETERERIVREANELGAAALGDPSLALGVRLVREAIERAHGTEA